MVNLNMHAEKLVTRQQNLILPRQITSTHPFT